jgi:hypothetical protein
MAALPDDTHPENTCAIASDLAGRTYGLNCLEKGVEDDDTNFTRFLLLARKGVANFLNRDIPVQNKHRFHLAQYRLEPSTRPWRVSHYARSTSRRSRSRPTSASLLNFLKFRSEQKGRKARNKVDMPRFRYCFYLDFLAGGLDENAENAVSWSRYAMSIFLKLNPTAPTNNVCS